MARWWRNLPGEDEVERGGGFPSPHAPSDPMARRRGAEDGAQRRPQAEAATAPASRRLDLVEVYSAMPMSRHDVTADVLSLGCFLTVVYQVMLDTGGIRRFWFATFRGMRRGTEGGIGAGGTSVLERIRASGHERLRAMSSM